MITLCLYDGEMGELSMTQFCKTQKEEIKRQVSTRKLSKTYTFALFQRSRNTEKWKLRSILSKEDFQFQSSKSVLAFWYWWNHLLISSTVSSQSYALKWKDWGHMNKSNISRIFFEVHVGFGRNCLLSCVALYFLLHQVWISWNQN